MQVVSGALDAVVGQARRRRHRRNGQRHGGDAGHRHQAPDDDDQRLARGTAEHPERARSVGGDADGADRLHGPRQRRRLRVRPAVELQRQGRQRQATTPGASTACRSPTWARPARRRSTTTSTASRKWRSPPAAPTRRTRPAACSSTWCCKKGLNTPPGDARMYFENQSLQAVNISPALAAALGNTTGKGNRTDKYYDGGFDLGGPMLKDRLWVWGTHGQTDINLLTLTGDPDNTIFKNYAFKVDGRSSAEHPRQLHLLREQQGEERPQRRPDASAGNHLEPDRPDQVLQGRGQLRRRQQAVRLGEGRVRHGGFDLAPVGGLNTDYYIDDGGVCAQLVLPVQERPAAALRRRRRQLLRRQARAQVRRRLALDAGRRRSRSGRRAT